MSPGEPAPSRPRRGVRWLLFGSLALNLFFIGIAVALAVRTPAHRWDRDVFVRIERLASTLPPDDAALLRANTRAHHDAIATAQKRYRDARDHIRETLRQEPFSAPAMRDAMAMARAARQSYDEVVQGAFAEAAAKMSPDGRKALADYRRSRRKTRKDRQ